MRDFLAELVGGEGIATALIWIVAVILLLVVVLVVLRLLRNLSSGTFIAGGRNRAPRLAVVDAAAIDNQRRLVLVRRDEVEHLILIGGPTDVVIEQQIRIAPPVVTGTRAAEKVRAEPPAPTVSPRPVEPAPARPPRPAPAAGPKPESFVPRPERPATVERPPQRPEAPERPHLVSEPPREPAPPVRQEQPAAVASAAVWRGEQVPEPRAVEEIDTALLEAIEPTAAPRHNETMTEPAVERRREASIEDEMSRLLDDLAEERKQGE